jgi:hypothetical protein
MSGFEEQLRTALSRLADHAPPAAPAPERLLRMHRHRNYRRQAAIAGSVAVAGVGSWGATGLVSGSGDGASVRVSPGSGSSPSASPAVNPACTGARVIVGGSVRASASAGGATPVPTPPGLDADSDTVRAQRAALTRITLPNPAPGFPTRRGEDTTVNEFASGAAVTRVLLLAVTPGITTTLAPGVIDTRPTGQEATVMVTCAGAFPTTPGAVRAANQYPVIGTTTALGQPATIVRSDTHQLGVLVSAYGLDIAAYGDSSSVPEHPVTAEQLVLLIESLQHLDG